MATRLKTIEYSLSSSVDAVSSGVTRILPQLMVHIPETGSRNFISCFVEWFTQDSSSAAASITQWSVFHRIGSTNYFTSSVTDTIANTGENMSFYFINDVTHAFSSSFGNTSLSNSFDFGVALTGNSTTNTSAKLTCTYEYDDTANIRVKTVSIPMDSFTGSISATGPTIIDTIPALNTYLPETDKVIRDVWFEFEGNDGVGSSVGPVSASIYVDNTKVDTTGLISTALISARTLRYIWKPISGSIDFSATHSIGMKSSTIDAPFDCISVKCGVTYEYNHGVSNNIMNCVVVPGGHDLGFIPGGPNLSDGNRLTMEIDIEEPQVTMSRCGQYHRVLSGGSPYIFITKISSSVYDQLPATFSFSQKTRCGESVIGTRFDSGSIYGVGAQLTRGPNLFYLDWCYGTSLPAGGGYSSIIVLNYESAKSTQSGGDANHTQFRKWFAFPVVSDATYRLFTASFYTPEPVYKFNGLGIWVNAMSNFNGKSISACTQRTGSDEGLGGVGWKNVFSQQVDSLVEFTNVTCIGDGKDTFTTFPGDASIVSKYIPTRNRNWIIQQLVGAVYECGYLFGSYHTITYSLTGSLSGYTGDGSGVPVRFYRADTNEYILTTTSSNNGEFHATWYDNVNPLYAEAFQDNTHVGRSTNITASGSP